MSFVFIHKKMILLWVPFLILRFCSNLFEFFHKKKRFHFVLAVFSLRVFLTLFVFFHNKRFYGECHFLILRLF